MRTLSTFLAAAVLLAAPGGCGLFGRTKASAVHTPASSSVPLAVDTVELEPHQTRLQNVGTFAIGEYTDRDVDTLQQTLEQSLAQASPSSSDRAFEVHVLVRRFLVAHSNNAGLAVACVAWALTDPQGKLVFHEQFYAADSVRLWGTIGGIKNHVHEGITRHVLDQAATVAAGSEPRSVEGDYVFPTYEAAAADLPASLTSVHVSSIALGGGYSFGLWTVTDSSQRDWVRQDEHVDWPARLALASHQIPKRLGI